MTPRVASFVVAAAWALCLAAIATCGYVAWRSGVDLDDSAVRQQVYATRAVLLVLAAFVVGRGVEGIARALTSGDPGRRGGGNP